ncbi:MAG: hypothetical protein ACKVWV_08520 [Planctomycetota bacterium]
MKHCRHGARIGAGVLVLLASSIAHAQCLEWSAGFAPLGINGEGIGSLATFDSGSGAELYACGTFATASGVLAKNIARWNGTSWSALGSGITAPGDLASVNAMLVFDDGSGPALYVGGDFTVAGGVPVENLARWDGSSWSAVGTTAGSIGCMVIHDDGSGDALYLLGADFQRWDGATLATAGPDTFFFTQDAVVFDDGSGATIYAGGDSSSFIRKWNGASWTVVGGGTNNGVYALEVFDDGNGPALYAGGDFTQAGGNPVQRIARWDGVAWSALGAPGTAPFSRVAELYTYDDGNGLALFAGGAVAATGQYGVYKWDGSSWTEIGATPTAFTSQPLERHLRKFVAFDDGSGPKLVVGGRFERAGDVGAINVASWDGTDWSALGGPTKSVGGQPLASTVFDDGSGPALFVAGRFVSAGELALNSIGKYDGTIWSDVGGGLRQGANGVADVRALEVFDDGGGAKLYAAGTFTDAGGQPAFNIARWNGTTWEPTGSGAGVNIHALEVFDDGSGAKIYAAGEGSLLRWESGQWNSVTGGGTDGPIFALHEFTSNGVSELYVGGSFLLAGGLSSPRVAKWRGSWTAISPGGGGQVLAFEVFAGGTGVPFLYSGGNFPGGMRRWNGSTWSAVTPPSANWQTVQALRVFDDGSGSGPALYAGGSFLVENGPPDDSLAKWDGTSWTEVGGGVERRFSPYSAATITTFGVFDDDGDGRADLFLGGTFASVGESPSLVNASNFAKWKACAGPGTAYCFGDSMATVDCPCAPPNLIPHPSGSAFGGCANSFNPHGAGLSAVGAVNPDTVTLFAHGQSPSGFCVFFKSSGVVPAGVGVLDGVSCASGALIRFGSQNAVNGTAQYPNVPLGHTIPLSDRGATPVGSGLTGHYQVVYRNTAANFCTADTLNFSSAYRITWN